MEKAVVKNSTQIIFPSELCRKTVEELVVKHRIKNGYVIPNPVASIFTDLSAVDASIERRIAAVGRYTRVKNFNKFLSCTLNCRNANGGTPLLLSQIQMRI